MKSRPENLTCCDADMNRRAFIRVGYLSLLGVGVADYLRAQSAHPAAEPAPAPRVARRGAS